MAIHCAETCLTEGVCTCRASAHDAELARVDAMSRARRADAILTETSSGERDAILDRIGDTLRRYDGHDDPLRDRLDDLAVQANELARLS